MKKKTLEQHGSVLGRMHACVCVCTIVGGNIVVVVAGVCARTSWCVCVCVCIKLVQSKVHTVCTGGSSSGQLLQRVLWVEEWRRKGIL